MDHRIVEFIAGLRAAGVRVSIAETTDAMHALDQTTITHKDHVRIALQAALIKDAHHLPIFQRLFPLYFESDITPMHQPGQDSQTPMSEQEQQLLQQMLDALTPEHLARLFEAMMRGQRLSRHEIADVLNQTSPPRYTDPMYQAWMARVAMRELQFSRLEALLQELLEQMRQAGVNPDTLEEREQQANHNRQVLAEQLEQAMGQRMLEQAQQPRTPRIDQLIDMPFERMSNADMDQLRPIVMRLAARLRSRAALRQRRAKTGALDAKRTIRATLQFGGVPIEIRHRHRHLKPKLTLICDLSYSMRPLARFTLLLIYTLHDVLNRTHSFAFIDDIHNISTIFTEKQPIHAIDIVMERVRPPYNYATDLGNSLQTFMMNHTRCIDRRTTVIFLADGRNNYHDPNVAALQELKRRVYRILWFNPEPKHMWGETYPDTLNSDMLLYQPHCHAVHQVGNLRQLARAVESLFLGR